MNVKVTNIEENVVELEFAIENAKFKEGIMKSYRKNVKRFNVPGFRKGKAPKMIIDKMYGPEIFYDDAINFVFPDAYDEAVKEAKITPVDRPEVDVKEIAEDKDLVLTAKVTVKPEVTIEDYKGIEIPKIEYNVSDADVDNDIKAMQERNSRLVSVEDRAAKKGDTVIIDYEGSVDGVPFEGGKAEKYSLELGSGHFIPGFEEQIEGKNINDEFEVNVTFPEEYHAEELKGKPAVFQVKLHEIKEKVLPDLDDEFAKDVSEFDTLEELKADTKKKLEETAANKMKSEKEAAVLDALCEKLVANIPEVMVESQIDSMMKDFEMRISSQGINLETYLSYIGSDEKTMRDSFKEQAEKRVKSNLALEKICELEKIEATDEDVQKEFEKMASMYNMEVDKIKELIKADDVKADLGIQKTLEFLVENTKVKKAAKKAPAKKTASKESKTDADGDKKPESKTKDETEKKETKKKTTAKKTTKKEE